VSAHPEEKARLEFAAEPGLVGVPSVASTNKQSDALVFIREALFNHWQALLLVTLCVISLLLLFHSQLHSYFLSSTTLLASIKEIYKAKVPLSWRLPISGFRERFVQIFTNPYYVLGVAGVLTLEWLFPAKKQNLFSIGFIQDFVYYFFISMFLIYATVPFIRFLDGFYAKHLAFLTIQSAAGWPIAFRIVFGLLLNDLLHWTHHFLRHRIRPLWYFHAIHHSQRQMNLFADARSHFIETFFALAVACVPLNMFSVTFANRGWVYLIPLLYFRLYHANIKTNLGPLKYVLVTPQSHRIHHSLEEKHWEKNYGFIFTVWDHIFRTQYNNYDEYPDTGIPDEHFPLEKGIPSVFKTFFVQLLYPFKQLFLRRT